MTALSTRPALHTPAVVRGPVEGRLAEIATPGALDFVRALDHAFAGRRADLLAARRERRADLAAGGTLDFLPETAWIRQNPSWLVAPPAPGLADRRVEITGPTDRETAVNALNSGAKVWLADFEDATAPCWQNMLEGQLNLLDAVTRRLTHTGPDGKRYELGTTLATIVVRPRGLHLVEKHVLVDGRPVSASVFDFALYLYHCGPWQLAAGSGPYFSLPKLEHHLEARWWNDLFVTAQELLDIPRGTIRATTLIETIPAAFQMEEILYELREHSAGLNTGRWDYIFSIIKNFGSRPGFVLPDRSAITMTVPFMRAYTELLVATCHRRGAHAIGGMSAFIPSADPAVDRVAFDRVRADKQWEAETGFDGSRVAHPRFVDTCREQFDTVQGARPNQVGRRVDTHVRACDLLAVDRTPGAVTAAGLRHNVSVALRYFDAWFSGTGAAVIDGLMADAATAEIARCEVWQWLHADTRLDDGTRVTPGLVYRIVDEEYSRVRAAGASPELGTARELLTDLLFSQQLADFFTTRAYHRLVC